MCVCWKLKRIKMEPRIRKPFDGLYPITMQYGDSFPWYVKIAGYPHNGIDFGMPDGTPILASDFGIVSYADNVPDADGLGINISHNWGLSQYWHLSKLIAKKGQAVKKGELIGFSGHSGWVTGPHLHFGIKVNGVNVSNMRGWADPALYWDSAIPAPISVPDVSKIYLVRPGDTLWGISRKFYGNGSFWRKIWDANRKNIPDPNLINIFQVLRIP